MQIKLTRSQAQAHIIDVAHALTTGADDVVVTLPGEWTTAPTADGYYFTFDNRSSIYGADGNDLAQVFIRDGKCHFFDGITYDLEDIAEYIRYWLGPLPEPEPPAVDDDDDLDAMPPGAILLEMPAGDGDDDD